MNAHDYDGIGPEILNELKDIIHKKFSPRIHESVITIAEDIGRTKRGLEVLALSNFDDADILVILKQHNLESDRDKLIRFLSVFIGVIFTEEIRKFIDMEKILGKGLYEKIRYPIPSIYETDCSKEQSEDKINDDK
jgi:hypothetical protein